MAALTLTDAALNEVRRLVVAAKAKRPVVHVSWDPQKADNSRGPNGETIWRRIGEGEWAVFVLDYDDPELLEVAKDNSPIADIHGLEFLAIFLDRDSRSLARPKLDFNEGRFTLTDAAI